MPICYLYLYLCPNYPPTLQVRYRADSIVLDVIELARAGHPFLRAHGDVTYDACHDQTASQPVTFTAEHSFVVVTPPFGQDAHGLEGTTTEGQRLRSVEFQLRTNEQNGLLMYSLGPESSSDFFALELLDGYLFLVLDVGAGVLKTRPGNRYITDGVMHTVALHLNGGNGTGLGAGVGGTLAIDGNAFEFDAPPGGTRGETLELGREGLYVGGLDRHNHYTSLYSSHQVRHRSRIPHELWSAGLQYGYVGCMQNLQVTHPC